MDRIHILYTENEAFEQAIKDFIPFIKKETLCEELIKKEHLEVSRLNDIEIGLDVEKI